MNKPPDRIETLEHKLHYLKHYDYSIFVPTEAGEYLSLRDLTPDVWAKTVAHWLENNMLPVRSISDAEAKEMIAEIQRQGGDTRTLEEPAQGLATP